MTETEKLDTLLERQAKLEVHMETMATNQMNLSIKLDAFLGNCYDTKGKDSKEFAGIQSNLKWLWVTGGIVVSGLSIAIGVIWDRVFA